MFYNEIFDKNIFNSKLAIAYGFSKTGDYYILQSDIDMENFNVIVKIGKDSFEANVIELPFNEEYVLFNVLDSKGKFVSKIRKKVNELIEDIVKNCFTSLDYRKILLDYVKETYGTIPEEPWEDNNHATIKTSNSKKWYGIFMSIPYKTLGLEKSGKIDVLNVKLNPNLIENLIDKKHFFPAYHMNKKYWISIVLDSDVDLNLVKSLIDESFGLVEKVKD
ncbi:MmcQ/YjbR family DNA-binding protein [Parvimonas micra]|uniref:MmcQ/YjbR family DNA-binding protein n=1 Tax=Parvimonas micra TaxID=33033 RepID=UPI00200316EE|nr:MmcQ/YjbR family DNA-binding protein [Parvimonas micra]MCK6130979.1 MmcQ/YjbR family DNA-binding protein [Parvimonas micra]MCK6136672.1 MmcQ/YjbR family DNA-binding protein [Parvimonas micra]MCK6138098.1 MmcQ/YjbR family DNA-binding protein [Parvimonas micra]MCK6154626.1 MmcQ/YjbR family DNA-binding protein [Parvimonas micra]